MASLWQRDLDWIIPALRLIILGQLLPEAASLGSHGSVNAGVKGFVLPKDLDAEYVLLELFPLPCDLLLYNEAQKTAELRRMQKRLAGQDLVELALDGGW